MNEDLILSKNIVDICYETVKLESGKKTDQIITNVIRFYIKHILGSKNIYLTLFLEQKLDKLRLTTDTNIYRKVLVEIYIFLAICNKPTATQEKAPKIKSIKIKEDEAENVLMNELNTYRKENVIQSCVKVLLKTKKDILWKIAENTSEIPMYISALKVLYEYDNKKELLLEAYKALSKEGYFYNNNEYSNMIFQCVLKINYIYEEMDKFNKHTEVYIKCLNYPIKYSSFPIQYNRISYIHEEKSKSLDILPKQPQEYMYFEKITKKDKEKRPKLL